MCVASLGLAKFGDCVRNENFVGDSLTEDEKFGEQYVYVEPEDTCAGALRKDDKFRKTVEELFLEAYL